MSLFSVILAGASLISLVLTLAQPGVYGSSSTDALVADRIPKSVGPWVSEDTALGEDYFAVLQTKDLLMRAFFIKGSAPDERVYLYIINTPETGKAAHPPELCIEGEGYNLEDKSRVVLLKETLGITANRLLYTKPGGVRREGLLVYYWYRVGGKNTDKLLANFFSFGTPQARGSALIRLSIPFQDNNLASREKFMRRYVSEVVPKVLAEFGQFEKSR